jgi:hypothetical protein
LISDIWAVLRLAGINDDGVPRKAMPLLPMKSLTALSRVIGRKAATPAYASDAHILGDAIAHCTNDIQHVTTQTLDSRRAHDQARRVRDLAYDRIAGINYERPIGLNMASNASAAKDFVTTTWSALPSTKIAWDQNLTLAVSALGDVGRNVTLYHRGTMLETYAASRPLLGKMTRIGQLLRTLKTETKEAVEFLLTTVNSILSRYLTAASQFTASLRNMDSVEAEMSTRVLNANATVQSEEATETALMAMRIWEEEQCEELRTNATDIGGVEAWDAMEQRVQGAMGRLGELYR